ncbi:epithelial sodium channel subunit alpha-like [Antedon mediterranea]|uniref:epithelial sodium channel subunit alpha-like n=1 Tax=Antedon mediterranea TaxID=105859 RepID=UPI003AF42374
MAKEIFEDKFTHDFYDWGFERVEGEFPPDWFRFLAFSNTLDYSDLQGVLKLTSSEISQYGHQLEDFILQCTFNKKECDLIPINEFQHDKYGNCYTFNSIKPFSVPNIGAPNETIYDEFIEETTSVKTSSLPGAEHGLKLTLNVEQHEYISIFGQDSGVKVSIHRQYETPFPEDDAITISPGSLTSIGLRMNKYSRLGGLYGNCTNDLTESMRKYYPDDTVYTVTGCQKACLQGILQKYCACVDTIFAEKASRCRILDNEQERCRQAMNYLHRVQLTDCDCRIPCR